MIKPDSCIYLTAMHPVFNRRYVPLFNNMDAKNSSHLFSSLLLNNHQNIQNMNLRTSAIYCLDEKDKEFVPGELKNAKITLHFSDTTNPYQCIRNVEEKYFSAHKNNFILFSDSIGLSSSVMSKGIDLLNIESDAVTIGRSSNNRISFIGFNFINKELLQEIHWSDNNYENLLYKMNKYDAFLHVLNKTLYVKSAGDFKILYDELSKKESWNYCNREMHEQFTHLFIEYKEQLK